MSLSTCGLLPTSDDILFESSRKLVNNRYADSFLFIGQDANDNKIVLFSVRRRNQIQNNIILHLSSGKTYSDTEIHFTENDEWQSRSLKLDCSYPMRVWRVAFNGLLRDANRQVQNHFKCNFLWHSISSPVYCSKKGNLSFSPGLNLRDELICNLYQGYEQWGTLHGIIQIDQSEGEEFNFTTLRKRSWAFHKRNSMVLALFSDNGLMTCVNSSINYSKGHFRTLRKHFCMTECDFRYPFDRRVDISFEFSGGSLWYYVSTSIAEKLTVNFENLEIFTFPSTINGARTKGIVLFCNRFTNYDSTTRSNCIFPQVQNDCPRIVDLRNEICLNIAAVGGKALSLAKINFALDKSYFTENTAKVIFIPDGFCITTNVMNLCAKENLDLKKLLNLLKYSIHEIPKSQLRIFCNKLQHVWAKTTISADLASEINEHLETNSSYAVRSSGVLEDEANFSAAGQHSTYLNLSSVENIILAIKKCWASAYSFESIEYRRNNGLPLITDLGVIIQKMVKSDVNGVLFTCHPVFEDPRLISLTFQSVEGIESTILIDKSNLNVENDSGEDNDAQFINLDTSCLSTEIISKLCKISLELEKLFCYPVDIEWTVENDNIFILQCRPITTLFTWTDFEICHELDSGFTEFDAITFHNCGEIMTDVTSPLSTTFNCEIMEKAYKLTEKGPEVVYQKRLLATHQFRVAMNICNGLLLHVNKEISFFQKILDIIVCGQVITSEELYLLAQNRNGVASFITSIGPLMDTLKSLVMLQNLANKCTTLVENFKIEVHKFSSPQLLMAEICEAVPILKEIAEYHLTVSNVSNVLKAVTLFMMAKDDEANLQRHITNLSLSLLNYDHTISGNIPELLKEIAGIICARGKKDGYLSVSLNCKQEWLEKNCIEALHKLDNFFKKYGSRSVKEADLITEPWCMKSDLIFECIDKLILFNSSESHESINIESTRVDIGQRYGKCVKWFSSLCKKGVTNRELTKQCLVLAIHQFRMAFRKLGILLAENSMIPDEKFIFYFTFYELQQIVNNQDRRLILHKAHRRQRLWDHLKSLQFDDVILGLPRPKEVTPQDLGICTYFGTSVSCHSARGRARVVQNFNEAKNINPGDIIITRSIDAGWSPYFPLISGLVTELGGLMSHGAIIARECGLPCVVGVSNATSFFQTGELVEISGPTGNIVKLAEISPIDDVTRQ